MKKKEFDMNQDPVDFVISVHVRNLFATYGEEEVRKAMKELFYIDIEIENLAAAHVGDDSL